MTTAAPLNDVPLDRLACHVEQLAAGGGRFAGLFAFPAPDGRTSLRAVVVPPSGTPRIVAGAIAPGERHYPSLTPLLPSASWYEREIHDLFGLIADGHPRLDPLVLPLPEGATRPRPGSAKPIHPLTPDTAGLPGLVGGEGVFTIPYGPVRSGVFEAVEYLVETPGEDIPYLRTRGYHKHRGIDVRFVGAAPRDGVLIAERVEGVAAVAHAIAFCEALERLAGVDVPEPARLLRVVHAELERVANHLDSVVRHAEAAGQAVAYARLSYHKERVMRLRARMCGHRFGRGVIIPGGAAVPLAVAPDTVTEEARRLEADIRADARLLMSTPSFIDRLRTTGMLPPADAAQLGALGPVGRGSGSTDDARVARPYAAYGQLEVPSPPTRHEGDALARQHVRWDEITASFDLLRQALARLGAARPDDGWSVPMPQVEGFSLGWAEAPQGEVLYLIEAENGILRRVKARSASFHNLSLFRRAFRGDIFTDFAFIEASFGLSIAGVSG